MFNSESSSATTNNHLHHHVDRITEKFKFNKEISIGRDIIFRTKMHPIPYYDYVAPLFDAQFGNKSIMERGFS